MTDEAPTDGAETLLPRLGDVPLSPERQCYLAPLLHTLLADFAKLEELERFAVEPVTTFRAWSNGDDAP